MYDEKEIDQLRAEEGSRGKRPKNLSERERLRRLMALALNAIYTGNRGLFVQTLSDLGQKPGSVEYEGALKKFEDYQREKL